MTLADKQLADQIVKERKQEKKRKRRFWLVVNITNALLFHIAVQAVILSFQDPVEMHQRKDVLYSSMSFDNFTKAVEKEAHSQFIAEVVKAEYSLFETVKDMTEVERDVFLYGKPWQLPYDTEPLVETIEVIHWVLDSDNNKVTAHSKFRILGVVVNEVQTIFNEIYDHPDKPVLHFDNGGGGYNPRWTEPKERGPYYMHPRGLAIDISVPENYMPGTTAGFWAPPSVDRSEWHSSRGVTIPQGGSEYSVAPDSPIVQIFNRYGWGWGGDWSGTKDYMHFSIGYPGIRY